MVGAACDSPGLADTGGELETQAGKSPHSTSDKKHRRTFDQEFIDGEVKQVSRKVFSLAARVSILFWPSGPKGRHNHSMLKCCFGLRQGKALHRLATGGYGLATGAYGNLWPILSRLVAKY